MPKDNTNGTVTGPVVTPALSHAMLVKFQRRISGTRVLQNLKLVLLKTKKPVPCDVGEIFRRKHRDEARDGILY
jgi:hypothetical protein